MLSSGIDIASILNKNEENLEETNNEDDGIRKNAQNSSNSLKSIGKSTEEKNKDKDDDADEENVLLKEIEASSKGKVKGSLVMNYFKSAHRSCTLIVLVAAFVVSQGLASYADIWISIW